MRADTCVHFMGIQHAACAAGVLYASVTLDHDPIAYRGENGREYTSRRSLPCLPPNAGGATCAARREPTAEEIAEDKASVERVFACLSLGVSPCCEAPLDESHVATSGRHKGTGPRLCSKCKAFVFHGCGRGSIGGGR